MGFEFNFLRLDPHRVPFGRYYDMVDELIECLTDGNLTIGVTRVAPCLHMSFSKFKEYRSFLK